jgi:ATP-dependent DNA helicase DinG
MELSVENFFNPDKGLIAGMKADFSPREGQAEFSEMVLKAINDQADIIAEAPTGFGKSFSVLVPAIISAVCNNKRIVISTETLTLQDQYIDKDLPLLQAACNKVGIDFTFAVAKGRRNYLCKAKLDEDTFEGADFMMKWALEQKIMNGNTGDIASVPFEFDPAEWRHVCADDDCERAACPFYGEGKKGETNCFVYHNIQKFLSADIVVANHMLTLIDCGIGAGTILGAYDALIVDEAHVFAEKAQDAWGVSFKPNTVSSILQVLDRMLLKVGVDYFEPKFAKRYRNLSERVLAPFTPLLGQNIALKQIDPRIIAESREAADVLTAELKRVNHDLSDYINELESHPKTIVIRACKERLSKLVSDLGAVYGDNINDEHKDNWLVFLETGYSRKRQPYGILNLKPIDVAPLMKGYVYNVIPTTVFMSATMRIGTSFGFMRHQLGVPEGTLEFIGESPFDFEKNVTGYFPRHLPDNRDPNYLSALSDEILKVLKHSNGKGLVLFTNNNHMRYCYEHVAAKAPHKCFLQGQASKPVLIEMFKDDIHSSLFATRTFFSGVDIPGEALSCLVLTKAPFEVPTDPMFKAKSDKIDEAGGDSFNMLSMPTMLFQVRQGFGRLIRTTDDKGIFAFLDSRAMNKSYGRRIVNALPDIQIVESLNGKVVDKPTKTYAACPKPSKVFRDDERDEPSTAAKSKTACIEDD